MPAQDVAESACLRAEKAATKYKIIADCVGVFALWTRHKLEKVEGPFEFAVIEKHTYAGIERDCIVISLHSGFGGSHEPTFSRSELIDIALVVEDALRDVFETPTIAMIADRKFGPPGNCVAIVLPH